MTSFCSIVNEKELSSNTRDIFQQAQAEAGSFEDDCFGKTQPTLVAVSPVTASLLQAAKEAGDESRRTVRGYGIRNQRVL